MTKIPSFFRPAARRLLGRPAHRGQIKDALATVLREERCCRMAPDLCGEGFLSIVRHTAELRGDWKDAEVDALIRVLDETVSSVAAAGPFRGDVAFQREADRLARELVAARAGQREGVDFAPRSSSLVTSAPR